MEQEKNGLSSLKSLFILEALARSDAYTSIQEICQRTGYSQSTVHRILAEMVEAGYADKSEKFKQYRVGPQMVVLGGRVINSNSIVTAARPEMLKLNELTGETIHLMSRADDEVIYIDKINTHHTLGLMSYVGKKNPMFCTSGGKCILAYLPTEQIERYIADNTPFQQYTEFTLTDPNAFREELRRIREQGYALDAREHHDNLNCVGAPIFDAHMNVIAAISVSAPEYRFSQEQALALAPQVRDCASEISARLGAAFPAPVEK